MKRKDTMSLGEFREATKNLPDDAIIMIVSEHSTTEALAVHPYHFATSLDEQNVFLLESDISDSVSFTDC